MWGSKLLGFNVWTEIVLIFVCGPKMTWLLCAGRKLLGFGVSVEIDKVFVWLVQIGLISV